MFCNYKSPDDLLALFTSYGVKIIKRQRMSYNYDNFNIIYIDVLHVNKIC